MLKLNSLKSLTIVTIMGIVFISLAITAFFVEKRAKQQLSTTIDENALNLLEATKNHVASHYNSIQNYKNAMISRRKLELTNTTGLAFNIVENFWRAQADGTATEKEARTQALNILRQLRYDDGIGYFWVVNTDRPLPLVLMHPISPEIVGTRLNDPQYYCALGKGENLTKAMVDISLEKGEGFVDYLWPKPMPGGLTEEQPKLSFVKLFKPWNWIIGCGVYIDDIEKDVRAQLDAVIDNLNKTIVKQKIGESGYFYIFNEKNIMLVHPNLAGMDVGQNINPATGNKLVEDFKQAAHSPAHFMEYLWDKPGHKGEYRYPKKAYATYFEPLGWYIGSSVYKEDLEKKVTNLTNTIFLFCASFLAIALIVSLLVSRIITTPLKTLIHSIEKIDGDGIPVNPIPQTGTIETQVLGGTMNHMIDAIRRSRIELKAQRDFSLGIIDVSPYIICGLDHSGITTYINPAGEKVTGYRREELIGKNFWELFYPGGQYRQAERLFEKFTMGEVTDYEMVLTCKNGEQKNIVWNSLTKRDIHNNITELFGFGNDITARKQAEEMMIQNEKMLSVGGLAAGMAHEINNPLAGMMQTANVMENRLSKGIDIQANRRAAEAAGTTMNAIWRYMEAREIPRMLAAINESGRRVAAIVENMLSFARKSDAGLSTHDLSHLLDKTLELAATDYDLRKHYDFRMIEIKKEYEGNLPTVSCERAKIQQVLLNILRNGAQAMQEAGTRAPLFIVRTKFETERKMVCVEIEDNGPGMDETVRKRVFEPFFTTKPVRSGTGLGLSVSYFIITKNHGGQMAVESRPGAGAKFIIRLPMEVNQ